MRKQSGKDKYPGKICISIAEGSINRAAAALIRANQLADLIELRLDYLSRPNLEELLPKVKKPLIVTNRLAKEGGKFQGKEAERLGTLKKAITLGVPFIDIELASGRDHIYDFLHNLNQSSMIISSHDFRKTGSYQELRLLLNKMITWGANVSKIVTLARSWADNLPILNLVLYARQRQHKIVAFCMGEKGKISRIVSPLLGGEWTYAALQANKKCAPGQLTIKEFQEIWRRIA
ncbi:MAG: type I 3-dehydroquinate dehydratase [Thermodesulfobacteriota bacterium]